MNRKHIKQALKMLDRYTERTSTMIVPGNGQCVCATFPCPYGSYDRIFYTLDDVVIHCQAIEDREYYAGRNDVSHQR